MDKIAYIVGNVYSPNGMSNILTAKINWLSENTNYEIHMILTERADLPWYYKISDKVKWVNFDINFDELDTMPIAKKIFVYRKKQKIYKKRLSDYLMQVKPTVTVSTIRRDINFINDIKDGSKKIGEIHFGRKNYRRVNFSFLPRLANNIITRIWDRMLINQLSRLEKFIVLTETDYKEWAELKNVCVIHNFIVTPPPSISSLTQKKVIAVGRYTYQKGFDLLFDAWTIVNKKHPDWTIDIYGGGDNLSYRTLARQKGIETSVSCNPAVNDINRRYSDHSIFVLSSRYEGLPLVLIEAMSAGLACVAFDCPCGPYDILEGGEDGLLVENGNTDKLADAICVLIENESLRQEKGEKALKRSKDFEKETIMHQWYELFKSLM